MFRVENMNMERTESETKRLGIPPWPSSRYAWYVVGVLTFAYSVAHVDRQILSLLIEPIRRDLNISDTEISLLGGFAFAIMYTFMGIPIGWCADNRNRRVIIGLGVSMWSLMTALCGLANTFGQMFLARVGVGIGEASLTPSAYSMIADYFPPHRLGRAMGVYMTAAPIGMGLALVIGGSVIDLVRRLPQFVLPLVGTLYPWQLVFFCVSLPGLVVLALMVTVREPDRRSLIRIQTEEQGESKNDAIPLRTAITFMLAHWKTYVPNFFGYAILYAVVSALLVWTPTMYIRTYNWSASSIGYAFGMSLLICGPIGTIGGGWLADFLRRKGYPDAAMRVAITAAVLMAPVACLMPLMPTANASLVLLAILPVFIFAIGVVVPTAFQLVTPNQFRGQVAAVSLFIVNLIGMGFGPTAVALINDYVFRDDMALRYSLSIMAGIFTSLGFLIFLSGLKSYRNDVMLGRT